MPKNESVMLNLRPSLKSNPKALSHWLLVDIPEVGEKLRVCQVFENIPGGRKPHPALLTLAKKLQGAEAMFEAIRKVLEDTDLSTEDGRDGLAMAIRTAGYKDPEDDDGEHVPRPPKGWDPKSAGSVRVRAKYDRQLEVGLEWIGEGRSGDYNAEDPDDVPLLRIDVNYMGQPVDDGSVCTLIPAWLPRKDLLAYARLVVNELRGSYTRPKKLLERLSYTGQEHWQASEAA